MGALIGLIIIALGIWIIYLIVRLIKKKSGWLKSNIYWLISPLIVVIILWITIPRILVESPESAVKKFVSRAVLTNDGCELGAEEWKKSVLRIKHFNRYLGDWRQREEASKTDILDEFELCSIFKESLDSSARTTIVHLLDNGKIEVIDSRLSTVSNCKYYFAYFIDKYESYDISRKEILNEVKVKISSVKNDKYIVFTLVTIKLGVFPSISLTSDLTSNDFAYPIILDRTDDNFTKINWDSMLE
mgnify:CR=1 FL=1